MGPLPRLLPNGTRTPPLADFSFHLSAMRQCGPYAVISNDFSLLSPSQGQVIHALPHPFATRLTQSKSNSPVRLACVKHAASVRPEPGSNSYVQFLFIPAGSSFNSPAFHSSFARVLPWLRRGPPGFTQVSPTRRVLPPTRRGSPRLAVSFLRFALYSFQGCALCCLPDSPFSLPNHLLLVNCFFTQF